VKKANLKNGVNVYADLSMKLDGSTDCPTTAANWISQTFHIKCIEMDFRDSELKQGFETFKLKKT